MGDRTFQEWVAVLSWYDGDTFHGVLDQGNGIFRGNGIKIVDDHVEIETVRHRCALINAPELRATGGRESLAYAQSLVPAGMYPCTTYKNTDVYGRPLIDLHLPDGRLFSDVMVQDGYAQPYGRHLRAHPGVS